MGNWRATVFDEKGESGQQSGLPGERGRGTVDFSGSSADIARFVASRGDQVILLSRDLLRSMGDGFVAELREVMPASCAVCPIRPPVCWRIALRYSRSTASVTDLSTSGNVLPAQSSRPVTPGPDGRVPCSARNAWGSSRGVICCPSSPQRIMARSRTLISSRTFPGQP